MNKIDSFIDKYGIPVFVLLTVILVLICLGISFGFCSLLLYIACWAFGFQFTWKGAIGVYVVLTLISGFFKVTIHEKD